ncbi:hypothetical protein [Thalassolituus sp. UBA6592]|uniref:hypothetical protein n=1 Tax=Thalassolituus sp. UBA6592 TaxID=1947665 RepID=UPI0025F1E4B7|nr:hypothetical protein [Thalassolituus sp. UBA6592]
MSASTTSTNAPYSNASSSSSPTPPHDYVPNPSPQPTQPQESGFSTKEVLIYGGGLILTAVVTYFSTLISVNSDISSNRESISVLKSGVEHLQRDVQRAENNIAKNQAAASRIGIVEVKINGLEKQFDAHVGEEANQ